MKVYKERQYLIFELDNGKTVKYDFATKKSIGYSGKEVKNICTQLSGVTIEDIINSCESKEYGQFLFFVKERQKYNVKNIGTLLSRVPDYEKFEQLYSAGLVNVSPRFKYTINEVPKGLAKIVRKYNWYLDNDLVNFYNLNPNVLTYAINNNDFISLSTTDIKIIFKKSDTKRITDESCWRGYRYCDVQLINELITEYGYTQKALWNYIDTLITYEALDCTIIKEIYDYAVMMKQISPKFDRYPRHFLTTHKIASRNYNRLKEKFDEEKFESIRDEGMEKSFDNYTFIYPKSTQDIKDEAVQQNNCVASYIKRVINGECHILFMRYKGKPEESLVTIEVRKGKIVQARRKFNDPVSDEEQEVINRWNKWYKTKLESEERSYDKAC